MVLRKLDFRQPENIMAQSVGEIPTMVELMTFGATVEIYDPLGVDNRATTSALLGKNRKIYGNIRGGIVPISGQMTGNYLHSSEENRALRVQQNKRLAKEMVSRQTTQVGKQVVARAFGFELKDLE